MTGENGSEAGSTTVQQILDTDIAVVADDDDDDDDDVRVDTLEEELKLKVADLRLSDACDTRHQFDVAERQSATLYVSRLSQFIVKLVGSATSSLDADKLLQEFSSTFCTGEL